MAGPPPAGGGSGAPAASGGGPATIGGGAGASDLSGASPHEASVSEARLRTSIPKLRNASSHAPLADAAIEGLPTRSQVFREAAIESWRSVIPIARRINEIAQT